MNGFSLLLALASLNVTYSWRAGIDQQQEYVLQIEPEIVQALVNGEEIYADVPADAGPFQRLCILVLAKDGTPVRHTAAGEEQFRQLMAAAGRYASLDRTVVKPDLPPTLLWSSRAPNPDQTYGVTIGWQPDKSGGQQYLVQVDPAVLGALTLGDELYVPVDPAAGRPVRFVVKAGRGNLPKVGGLASGSRYDTPPTQTPAPRNNRFGGLNDTTNSANTWDNSRYADGTRQLPRNGTTAGDTGFVDNSAGMRVPGQLPPPLASNTQYGQPTYSNAPLPNPTYPSGVQPPPTQGYVDPYRTPPQFVNSQQPYGAQQPASQQPQLPATAPQFQPQYAETRVAALPPAPTGLTPNTPATGFAPNTRLAPQADKPWGPLLFVTFALFFSIGGNLYLAWAALEFHSRYRSAIERLRAAARSA